MAEDISLGEEEGREEAWATPIKETCSTRADVQDSVDKHRPDEALASRHGHLFNEQYHTSDTF